MYPPLCADIVKNSNGGDTTLRLNGFGSHEPSKFGIKTGGQSPDDGFELVLGLGSTSGVYSDNYSKGDKAVGVLSQHDSVLKLGLSGLTHNEFDRSIYFNQVSSDGDRRAVAVGDEGSMPGKKSCGYMRVVETFSKNSNCQVSQLSSEPSSVSDYSMSAISDPLSASASSNSRGMCMKRCKFDGCMKGARGGTGLCIGHGGGQRCQKPGCTKGAESRTAYCKGHGGGSRCQQLGCTKSAEGKTDFCIAHGGGRRCGFPGGCSKAARGKSGLCIKHGGGKRCKVEGCSRSAEGMIGLCISHGGGRRCQSPGCTKGAQGSTLFCKAHGGGKRCIFSGCTKGAEGSTPLCKGHGGGKRCLFEGGGICQKSVHGGTSFCVAHGGGKRCCVPGCTKSARGRTDKCVRHGGGKRCRVENCGKSAQGSTDLCKAHGGGKRCKWGEGKCGKFARGKIGLCAAHTNMIGAGMFQPTFSMEKGCSSSGVSVVSDSRGRQQQLIPPQVLVPRSMRSSSTTAVVGSDYAVPEGRVHGGGLLSLLGGDLNSAINGN